MDQEKKVGELISMNSERPGIIHLYKEEKVTIGKDQQNTNRIDDNRIAKFHCSIFYQDGFVVLKNLCQQGTFLNKKKMGLNLEVNLEHGDHIHLLCMSGKKVPENHVIAYMFFKYEDKKQKQILEKISDNLVCIICQDIYYEAVAVSPCGHVFCGYCLQVWENEKNTCPICRVKMRNITKAFQINKLIDVLHEVNPEIEQNKKPPNKYFLQFENVKQNESDSESDSDSDEEIPQIIPIPEVENQIMRRSQGSLNLIIDNYNSLLDTELLILQPYRLFDQQQNIEENLQLSIQQNSQQNERLNAQQNQQNGQAQNIQENYQSANIQTNSQPPQINQQ